MNPAEASRSGAAQQAEQERLGLIVTRMTGRDDVGAELGRDALEELVARLTAGILHRRAELRRPRAHVDEIRAKRHARFGRERAAKLLVVVGRSAQAVIEVGHARDRQLAAGLELAQQPQQRDRIRPARERDEHTIARPQQRAATNRVEDARGQCHGQDAKQEREETRKRECLFLVPAAYAV